MNQGISVIICCFNSAVRLPETLSHIAQQKITVEWELIIVNNASTDNTVEVAKNVWARLPAMNNGFKVIHAPHPGLLKARKAGLSAARYEYIVFCDDDNWLDYNYLTNAYAIFENHPTVGYIGGSAEAVFGEHVTEPTWFKENRHAYAVGRHFEKEGIQEGIFIWGAGLCVKRSALQQVFSEKYPMLLNGRIKNIIASGEDSEICLRLHMLGYRLYCTERLKLRHFIASDKLTDSYKKQLHEGFNHGNSVLESYIAFIKKPKGLIARSILFIKEAIRLVFPYYPNRGTQASRNLFVLTGLSFFGNEYDKLAGRYHIFAKNVKKK